MKVNIMFYTHQFHNCTHTIHNVYISCIATNVNVHCGLWIVGDNDGLSYYSY